jgi:imidazolonepropionase-like amidohydrolase
MMQMKKAGIRIAMGTDSGAANQFQGYFEHMELELMVKAGLTPMQAIVAATGDAAACMKRPGIVGTLQPGAWADLAVYTASPLAGIRNTKTLESVWVSGEKLP